jgi:hypothetical protein
MIKTNGATVIDAGQVQGSLVLAQTALQRVIV